MRQSIFKKEYSASGVMGTFKGEVVVTMNDSSKTIKGTHAGTHDDFEKEIPTHKVEGSVNGKSLYNTVGIESESEVLKRTKEAKERVVGWLTELSANPPAKTFPEKINEILNS